MIDVSRRRMLSSQSAVMPTKMAAAPVASSMGIVIELAFRSEPELARLSEFHHPSQNGCTAMDTDVVVMW